MTDRDTGIYEALLEDLSDGVLVVDFDGSVRIANAAFCRMFGLDPAGPAGCRFGELFVASEGLDEFTQAVLDAVLHRGGAERRIASVLIGGEQRSLSVTTTYLTAARQGGRERVAVIAVVSDITEVRELRETELRMAKVIETQLGELQEAYRDLEARNEALSVMTRRVRSTRAAAMLFVAVVFLAIGAWHIRLDLFSANPALGTGSGAGVDDAPDALHTVTVAPSALRSTIALRGHLAPGRVMNVVSQIESHVNAVHASPGQLVGQGDPLVELDTGQHAKEHRSAEIEYIKARDRLAALEDWDDGVEMGRARRTLRRARIALDDAERTLARAAFLLDQGIVPASEHEEAQRGREHRKLDFEAAERDLLAVKAKGGEEALRVARLELETARERLRAHESKRALATLRAPIAGIVIAADGLDDKPLARGRPVAQGELLASVADFERLSVVTSVDEVDVRKIAVGQRASIAGPGFPGLRIKGTVARVSSRADGDNRRRAAPRFEIVVALDRLDAPARGRLRVGMSAHVEIVVHSRPSALLVPIGAVEQEGGAAWVRVVGRDARAVERRAVALGLTTLDSVEVVEGLAAGDEVVLPR